MAVVTTKSASIVNLDALPIVAMATGEGASGVMRVQTDFVAAGTGDSIGSIYRVIRIPTNAKVKRLILNGSVVSAGSGDIDVAFSDAPDLPAGMQALAGTIVQITGPADNKLFGAAHSLVAQAQADITFAGSFVPSMQNLPLWQALVTLGTTQFNNPNGVPVDPGGFFDIVIKLTTGVTTGGPVSFECDYVE